MAFNLSSFRCKNPPKDEKAQIKTLFTVTTDGKDWKWESFTDLRDLQNILAQVQIDVITKIVKEEMMGGNDGR